MYDMRGAARPTTFLCTHEKTDQQLEKHQTFMSTVQGVLAFIRVFCSRASRCSVQFVRVLGPSMLPRSLLLLGCGLRLGSIKVLELMQHGIETYTGLRIVHPAAGKGLVFERRADQGCPARV